MAGGGVSTTVTVTYNGHSTDIQYNNETLYIKIPAHTEYTLSFGSIQGDEVQTLHPFTTTSQSYYSRSLHLKYYPYGIYIMDANGVLYTVDSWASGSNATGVIVFTDTVRLLVAPDEEIRQWGGYEKTVSGIVTTTYSTVALADFAGSSNTDQIISQLTGYDGSSAPAAEYCRAYSNGYKGVGEWYLPATGEMNVLVTNKDTINIALSKISGKTLESGEYGYTWTSTQYDSRSAWRYGWVSEDFANTNKHYAVGVRPVCQL